MDIFLNELSSVLCLAENYVYMFTGFLITLSPNGPLVSNKVAIIKTKKATIAIFSSPPFLLLALSFSPFLFLRYYDFSASRAKGTRV